MLKPMLELAETHSIILNFDHSSLWIRRLFWDHFLIMSPWRSLLIQSNDVPFCCTSIDFEYTDIFKFMTAGEMDILAVILRVLGKFVLLTAASKIIGKPEINQGDYLSYSQKWQKWTTPTPPNFLLCGSHSTRVINSVSHVWYKMVKNIIACRSVVLSKCIAQT